MRVYVRAFVLLCSVVGMLVWAQAASGQVTTGALRGEVTDESGAILPGVTVELSGPALVGGPKTTTTDDRGQYRFLGLAPGGYTLAATLQGFQAVRQEGIRVEVGAQFEVNFKLKVGGVAEAVTVTGRAPTIDSSRSALTTTLTSELIQATPTSRFFFMDLAFMAPGVSVTRHNNTNFRAVAFGSSVNENMFLLDGFDVTATHSGASWTYPGQDMIEEIEVIGLGASAEYGNFQGAVFNIVTRSGGNRFGGEFNYFAQPSALAGENARVKDIPYHRANFHDATLVVGGPLRSDKLRYFGHMQHRGDGFSEPGVDPKTPSKQTDKKFFGKLTWQVNKKNTLTGSFYVDPGSIPGQVNVANPYETVTAEVFRSPFPNVTWISILGEGTILDVRYSGFYGTNSFVPNSKDRDTPGHQDVATGVASVNAIRWADGDYWRTQVNGKLSHYVENLFHGSHDFRVGMMVQDGGAEVLGGFPGGRFYYDRNGQPDRLTIQNPSMSGARMRGAAVFASDTWGLGKRVSVNPGLRFDYAAGIVPDYDFYDAEGKPIGQKASNPGKVWSFGVVSPRLGFNVILDDAGGTVARAHYGWYYQGLNTSIIQPLSRASAPSTTAQWDGTRYVPLFTVDTNATNRRIDPNLKDPHTEQFSIGVDRELLGNLRLGATFVYKKWHDLIGLERIGAQYVPVVKTYVDRRGGQDVVRSMQLFNQTDDPGDDILEIRNRDIFHQNYKGLVITLNKRMSNRWMVLGTYTWSVSKGLNAGSDASDPYVRQSSVGNWGTDPNELVNADGYLIDDRPHMLKIQYAVQFPWDVQVSGDWELLTGKPIFPRAIFGLAQGNISVFVEPKDGNVLRAPNAPLFAIRAQKDVRLSGRTRVRLSADVLNLFNNGAFYSVQATQVTSAVYGLGATFVPPRRAMLSARLFW
jgi:hypothetical protein